MKVDVLDKMGGDLSKKVILWCYHGLQHVASVHPANEVKCIYVGALT